MEISSPYGKLRLTAVQSEAVAKVDKKLSTADLSADQLPVFDRIVSWATRPKTNVLTLGGFAGTGKSTLLALVAHTQTAHRIAFCAFTGKASNVLRKKLLAAGVDLTVNYCGTVHRLMYKPIIEKETQRIKGWKKAPEIPYSLIVIDEASMIDQRMYTDLLGYGIPILAVGDHGQLPPVKGKANLMLNPDLKLEKIHRQAESNPIIRLSAYIREHQDLPDSFSSYGKDVIREVDKTKFVKEFQSCNLDSTGILSYKNETRVRMNDIIRRHKWGENHKGTLFPDDLVICLKNTRFGEEYIFNGMRGKVLEMTDHGDRFSGIVNFEEDGIEVESTFFKSQFGRKTTYADLYELNIEQETNFEDFKQVGLLFDYGFTLTCHKAQGSQFDHVIVAYEKVGGRENFGRWLYTAVTRAAETLVILR